MRNIRASSPARRGLRAAMLVLALGWGTGLSTQARAEALPAAVHRALERAEVPAHALGAVALPLRGLALPWRHRAEVPMQPGSTMKLLTSIVALDRLGPNLRGRTELLAAAELRDGVLRGDLVLRGGADPDFGWPQLWALLLELREQGLQEIAGDLVLDRSLFSPPREDVGVPPFDPYPEWPYNVIPDALHFNGSLTTLVLQSDDRRVLARTVPTLEGVRIDVSGLILEDGGEGREVRCARWDDGWQTPIWRQEGGQGVVELRGRFPRGCTARAELQLVDRTALTGLAFRTLWRQLGGRWEGRVREGRAPAEARLLLQRESRPWGEVLRGLNKRSDNAQTRLLYLLLGARAWPPPQSGVTQAREAGSTPPPAADGSTRARADAVVRSWLAEHGIGDAGLVMDNGSGLSRSERMRPAMLAQALAAAHAGRHASDLMMSLPVPGVDGTMRNRLRDSRAAGWARLKTGTLRDVVALAGYVSDPLGRPWVVVAMVNHERAARARPVLDAFVDWVARGQPADDVAAGTVQAGP